MKVMAMTKWLNNDEEEQCSACTLQACELTAPHRQRGAMLPLRGGAA